MRIEGKLTTRGTGSSSDVDLEIGTIVVSTEGAELSILSITPYPTDPDHRVTLLKKFLEDLDKTGYKVK